jgi:hypothetical protein
MVMQKQLKRGDVVRRSIEGAKGFFYPDIDGKAIMVQKACMIDQQVGWNTCQDFVAYHAPAASFAEKDRYNSTNKKMVVWVKKNG